jgi:hypothetical protein
LVDAPGARATLDMVVWWCGGGEKVSRVVAVDGEDVE